MPASRQTGQSKPGFFIADINRFIGGWHAGTPRQVGSDEEAHSRTSQPHSSALAGVTKGPGYNRTPATIIVILKDIGNLPVQFNKLNIINQMATSKRKKADTDLGTMILRNIAATMERERERRGLNKKELAHLCEMTSPYYLRILDGSANPSLQVITRISTNLKIPLQELMMGQKSGNP
ncbi:helix-turn-helix domain-containing protein [Neorhizobium lilium]|nr:helix-turn-helix transcriptional regulator [Neorhizobium lilium]